MNCFRNNVVPPSWTLILPESWDESKTYFKGEVDGFKVFSVAFQDGGHDQCTSEVRVKKRLLCRLWIKLFDILMNLF